MAQVLINEVCSDNETIILDEFNESADWIELYNSSDTEVDLTGWFLSDDSDDNFKWRFPEVSIGPNSFLIIFASGRDIVDQNIHTNFKLSKDGELLILSNSNYNEVYKLIIPRIDEDFSYGQSNEGLLYFSMPTPNAPNNIEDAVRVASSCLLYTSPSPRDRG